MVVRLLGTGAADGIPAFFAESRVSDHARRFGGKDVRSRTAALIDGQLKIDFGPDTLAQCHRFSLDPRQWVAILFTHSDADHFAPEELQYALYPFNESQVPTFAVYANATVCDAIEARYPDWPFELHRTTSFEPFRIAEYRIVPIAANHSRDEDCQNLIIESGQSRVLYATDTGLWNEETWAYLQDVELDALVIECTNGRARTEYWGHLNVQSCLGVVERLRKQGTLRADAAVITTHHSHEGDLTHDELVAVFAPHGIEPGYDGMEFEVVRAPAIPAPRMLES